MPDTKGKTAGSRTLLAVYAHPDDESFGTGGMLAHYAAEGVRVALVCATRGEAGEIADSNLATPETLGHVREAELRCAAETLGLTDLIILDYRDSGMAGSPDNRHPRALINAPADEVVGQLVGIIRRLRPQVVVTFEPNGGYGHPDHIAIHRYTVAAFHAAADPSRYPEQGATWRPSRLFYTGIPRSFFMKLRDRLVALGRDTSFFDRFEVEGFGWPDEEIHVAMDIGAVFEAKWRAFLCHRTQFGPDHLFRLLPEDEIWQMMRYEHFAQAWPPLSHGHRLSDLFEGL
ncbi:MAG: PIG-L family deacetylase [Anaerolineae bacterium]|nr:PIG-L family deacetylase [Anaerolineae bacterium]MDW8100428.1 PIG-L family deacetylase [Anaerolineae bacterium]